MKPAAAAARGTTPAWAGGGATLVNGWGAADFASAAEATNAVSAADTEESESEAEAEAEAEAEGEGRAAADGTVLEVEGPDGVVLEAEGLKLHLSAQNKTGCQHVTCFPGRPMPFRAMHNRVYLGHFATAVEAAVCYARHVQQQQQQQ